VYYRAQEPGCVLISIRVDDTHASVPEDIVRLDTSSNLLHARISHDAGRIIYELWKQFREVGSDMDNNTGQYFFDSCRGFVSCTDLHKTQQQSYLLV
jgi:hypothetical protein